MSNTQEKLDAVIGPNRIAQHEPLDQHTILKKGGIAEFYVEIERVEELIKLVQKAREVGLPVFVMGSGAIVTAPNREISGLIIKNTCRKFDKISMKGKITGGERSIEKVLVSAEAGVLMNQLVRFTIEEGLEGLEYQLGLPGTVGGAIATNAAYKTHGARERLHSVRVLTQDGEVQMYTLKFPFLSKRKPKWQESTVILLSMIFELTPQDKKILWERGSEAVEYRRGLSPN